MWIQEQQAKGNDSDPLQQPVGVRQTYQRGTSCQDKSWYQLKRGFQAGNFFKYICPVNWRKRDIRTRGNTVGNRDKALVLKRKWSHAPTLVKVRSKTKQGKNIRSEREGDSWYTPGHACISTLFYPFQY